jgi:CheY-like chemotaxis protein
LSERGIRNFARLEGKNFDLVIVDYNLGREDTNGAVAASKIRGQLPYTDIIFYSTDQSANLLGELARQKVAGVFVAERFSLDDALKGVADTIIKKVVDLCHMRGAAMAEVADMDVLMEDILDRAFAVANNRFQVPAKRTLEKVMSSAKQRVTDLEPLVEQSLIIEVIKDSRLFTSMDRYRALCRLAKLLPLQPEQALKTLKTYDTDIIRKRNTLAHAKEETGHDGAVHLRSIKRGEPSIVIDDAWMVDFRGKLREHRAALTVVCDALASHIDLAEP